MTRRQVTRGDQRSGYQASVKSWDDCLEPYTTTLRKMDSGIVTLSELLLSLILLAECTKVQY